MYEAYKHHDVNVWVRSDLKGKHREYCMCFSCKCFNPEDRSANCKIANAVYGNCVGFNIVTPVWECQHFTSKNKKMEVNNGKKES
jgi:hypothetical protein